MTRNTVHYLLVATLALCTNPASATIIFSDGTAGTIINTDPQEDFEIQNGPADATTTVTVEDPANVLADGNGRSIGAFGTSVLNMTGGTAQGNIELNDSSVFNFSGGAVLDGISVADNSSINVAGGAADSLTLNNGPAFTTLSAGTFGEVTAEGTSTLILNAGTEIGDVLIESTSLLHQFNGGTVEEYRIDGPAGSAATINGGTIGDDLDVRGNSIINVFDVFVDDDVDTEDNGVLNIFGGVFDEDIEAADNSQINILGGTFERVFSSDDGDIIAGGGEINVLGGTFGVPGTTNITTPDLPTMSAQGGGTLNIFDFEVAGESTNNAPTVTLQALTGSLVTGNNIAINAPFNLVSQREGSLVDISGLDVPGLRLSSSIFADMNISNFNTGDVELSMVFGDATITDGTAGAITGSVTGSTFDMTNVDATSMDVVFGASTVQLVNVDAPLNLTASGETDLLLEDLLGVAPISGGSGFIVIESGSDIVIKAVAGTFQFNGQPVPEGLLSRSSGFIDGRNRDGTTFSIGFLSALNEGGTVTLMAVPEPSSVILVSLLVLCSAAVLRRRAQTIGESI